MVASLHTGNCSQHSSMLQGGGRQQHAGAAKSSIDEERPSIEKERADDFPNAKLVVPLADLGAGLARLDEPRVGHSHTS